MLGFSQSSFLARMANKTPYGRARAAHPLGVLLGFLFRMAHAMRSIASPAGVTRTPPAQGSPLKPRARLLE